MIVSFHLDVSILIQESACWSFVVVDDGYQIKMVSSQLVWWLNLRLQFHVMFRDSVIVSYLVVPQLRNIHRYASGSKSSLK